MHTRIAGGCLSHIIHVGLGKPIKTNSRVTDDELFTRLLYYGLAHLNLTQDEVWLMPFGLLLDLWECHRQYNGIAKPKREITIDDVIPFGI